MAAYWRGVFALWFCFYFFVLKLTFSSLYERTKLIIETILIWADFRLFRPRGDEPTPSRPEIGFATLLWNKCGTFLPICSNMIMPLLAKKYKPQYLVSEGNSASYTVWIPRRWYCNTLTEIFNPMVKVPICVDGWRELVGSIKKN